MQYIEQYRKVIPLPVASNDNEDLLDFPTPAANLAIVRELKKDMRSENAENGMLLSSRKQRHFFQEVVDAERYLLMRYFMCNVPEDVIRAFKRYILDHYLFPRRRRPGRKKLAPAT
jgi:hypothetical protein